MPSYSVFVCWYVTWPCDLDLLTLNSWHTWRVTWQTLPLSLMTLRLFVLDLWVITFPVDYHWKCVRDHCACAESRDPWVGGPKQLHFWNSRPRFAYLLYNFSWATSLDLVTLTFDLLIFNSCHTWRVTRPTLPPSLKTVRLFVHELRVITFPFGYHWECVRGHCACAESRDPWVGGRNNYIFGILDPDLPIYYTTSLGLRWRLRVVYSRASPLLNPLILVRDLVTLTFDLEQLTYMAGHVTNLATKF